MTQAAQELIAAFDSLAPEDQQQVTAELLRTSSGAGGLPAAELDEMAAELFRAYDLKEAAAMTLPTYGGTRAPQVPGRSRP